MRTSLWFLAAIILGAAAFLLLTSGEESILDDAFDVTDEPSAGPADEDRAAGAVTGGVGVAAPEAWKDVRLDERAHGLPGEVVMAEIVSPSEAEWTPTGGWLLEHFGKRHPGIAIAFHDEAALADFRRARWPQPFPGRMHTGMLITSLPDIGFRAVHVDGTLYVMRLAEQPDSDE